MKNYLRWIPSLIPAAISIVNAAPNAETQLINKGFDQAWIGGLTAPDTPRSYTGDELNYIGMPIGGQYAGQVYLSGDGRLWYWDVFNKRVMNPGGPGDRYYNTPMLPANYVGVEQSFWIEINGNKRSLSKEGFNDITFTGTYPVATIDFKDAGTPVNVRLKAYSPFAPLNDRDSSIPATILSYTLTNTGNQTMDLRAGGWLKNPTHRSSVAAGLVQPKTLSILDGQAIHFYGDLPKSSDAHRDDIIIEDFENGYGNWSIEGEAFGSQPFVQTDRKPWQPVSGQGGTALANSHNTYVGDSSQQADSYTGRIISEPFTLNRNYLTYKIGGGKHSGKTGIRLLIDGKQVAQNTGSNRVRLQAARFDLREYQGKQATLEIFDEVSGGWGHIIIDDIVLTDNASSGIGDPTTAPDAGTFALALLDQPADTTLSTHDDTQGQLLSQSIQLKPGESKTVSFSITWHMPNIHNGERALWALKEMKQQRHYYTTFYNSAEAVAEDLIKRYDELNSMTDLWVQTWYDSTLPNWFLNRTFFNVSTLATTTAHRFHNPTNPRLNNRVYFWEGVYLGDGTCTHVTHYEQALGRLFPQAARDQRRAADFEAGWNDKLGYVRYRAEFGYGHHFGIPHAADGHAGTILRTYREHTTNSDNSFLAPEWPKVKRAMQFMIDQDAGRGFFETRVPETDNNSTPDGLLTGPQYNTLDRYWFGKIPWISGLYQAALLAAAEMADDMNDPDFATTCREIAAHGKINLTAQLFNKEYGYYVQKGHEGKNAININDGSHIDQVLGQYWAKQVGLPNVFPESEVNSALSKLFEHNFYRKAGDYRKDAFLKAARFYVDDDEPGMFMCTFPHGGAEGSVNEAGVIGGYFSECMDGFTYSAAAAMISQGLVTEGLALCRSIDDRYAGAPLRRNPFNEIEYGNHYSRSMASYAPFISITGFTYNGPRSELGFAPKLNADNFKAAFTAAEGWGSISQQQKHGTQLNTIEVKYGTLELKTLSIMAVPNKKAALLLNGKRINASGKVIDGKLVVTLKTAVKLSTGDKLEIKQG